MVSLTERYADYPVQPFISKQQAQDHASGKVAPAVPRKNMESLEGDVLAGDVILMWRIALGTFTTESVFPKYFEYTYGIDAPRHLEGLVDRDLVRKQSARESLAHINAGQKKAILKNQGVKGFSKMKAAELDQALLSQVEENALEASFDIRGYILTPEGQALFEQHPQVLDRHPKKM
ncbi:hypothetical protein ACXM1Q_008800 [Streptococcus sp. 10F2]